jgi:hypothetical protein
MNFSSIHYQKCRYVNNLHVLLSCEGLLPDNIVKMKNTHSATYISRNSFQKFDTESMKNKSHFVFLILCLGKR